MGKSLFFFGIINKIRGLGVQGEILLNFWWGEILVGGWRGRGVKTG